MKIAIFISATWLLFAPSSLRAATFGAVTEVYADNSERNYVIRFLDDGRECLWTGPTVSNCPTGCLASSASPVGLPSCLSLCGGGLNMTCPWSVAPVEEIQVRRRIAVSSYLCETNRAYHPLHWEDTICYPEGYCDGQWVVDDNVAYTDAFYTDFTDGSSIYDSRAYNMYDQLVTCHRHCECPNPNNCLAKNNFNAQPCP